VIRRLWTTQYLWFFYSVKHHSWGSPVLGCGGPSCRAVASPALELTETAAMAASGIGPPARPRSAE
jgi:hypothetical protein